VIKAIFWDNDGVLVDTERLYFAATQQILWTVGVHLTRELFIEFNLVQGKGAWHIAKAKGVSQDTIDQLRHERDALYDGKQLIQDCNTIPGSHEVLEALYGKYLMGIVTSSRKDHFELIHQFSVLLKFFDFVLTANDYKKFKPDPEPYLLAVKKSGFTKEECIAVEDSERGLISTKEAGIRCMVIPTELTQNGDFSKADKVLRNIMEVLEELHS
jgi:beta-phosphoglucomutase-like phosphatase (HAD superfamily)